MIIFRNENFVNALFDIIFSILRESSRNFQKILYKKYNLIFRKRVRNFYTYLLVLLKKYISNKYQKTNSGFTYSPAVHNV